MKTGTIIRWLTMAAVCSGLIVGGNPVVADRGGQNTVSGSGTVVSQVREMPGFNRILLKGTGQVYLAKGDVHRIEIRTDDNILPLIKTEVKDQVLGISDENFELKPTALEFHIIVKQLKGITTSGSGDVTGQSTFEADDFDVQMNGSGDMNLPIVARRLKTIINGSGSMTLTGETDDYEASIKGSGDIRAVSLKTKNASVSIAGSGNCTVFVSDILRADIAGSGDVVYLGRPRIESRVRGSGSVNGSN